MMVSPMPDWKVTDWNLMARAANLELSEDDLSRTVAPLSALETAFRNAAATVTADLDPALVFDPAPEEPAA